MESDNSNILLIVDDSKPINPEIADYLPYSSFFTIFTTRHPNIFSCLSQPADAKSQTIRLSNMDGSDFRALFHDLRRRHDAIESDIPLDEETTTSTLEHLYSHPLALTRAVPFMYTTLSDNMPIESHENIEAHFKHVLEAKDPEVLDDLLHYPRNGSSDVSVMDCFQVSQQSLEDPTGVLRKTTELLAFLETSSSTDFRGFFTLRVQGDDWSKLLERNPDLRLVEGIAGLLDAKTLIRRLNALEKKSLGSRGTRAEPPVFHPLWMECLQHQVGHDGRKLYLSQILRLCAWALKQSESHETVSSSQLAAITPHIQRVEAVMKTFHLNLEQLDERVTPADVSVLRNAASFWMHDQDHVPQASPNQAAGEEPGPLAQGIKSSSLSASDLPLSKDQEHLESSNSIAQGKLPIRMRDLSVTEQDIREKLKQYMRTADQVASSSERQKSSMTSTMELLTPSFRSVLGVLKELDSSQDLNPSPAFRVNVLRYCDWTLEITEKHMDHNPLRSLHLRRLEQSFKKKFSDHAGKELGKLDQKV